MPISDRDKILNLKAIEEKYYKTIDLDRLVVYAISQLEKIHADLSFENAVAVAYVLFPKKFSLPGFSNYPDSDRVQNCLNRCTRKNRLWLGGKSRHGFFVTDRSRQIITQIESRLSGQSPDNTKHGSTSQTRRKETILEEVASSPAYIKYSNDRKDAISPADLCFVLQGTLDTSKETLKENLITLIKFAEELQRSDVLQFAKWLEKKFSDYFLKPA